MLRDFRLTPVDQLIGVAPGQFVVIVAIKRLSESQLHPNLRLWFECLGLDPGGVMTFVAHAEYAEQANPYPQKQLCTRQSRKS